MIAMDWGSSAWRGALLTVDGPSVQVIEERSAPRGILAIDAGGFAQAWRELCGPWLDSGASLCLMSGMVGSRQGWVEAPYIKCPVAFTALATNITWIEASTEPLRTGIVAGLCGESAGVPDVMRGEEVQIFGAAASLGVESGTLVLPGTHSKWAVLERGEITAFRTYMTGEVYALLRQQSILSRLMPTHEQDRLDASAFRAGVHASERGSLLSMAFSARTLGLFEQLSPEALPSYLSGLLIGEEMRSRPRVSGDVTTPIIVVGSPALTDRYGLAADVLGLATTVPPGHAAWAGLWHIAKSLLGDTHTST